MDDYKVCLKCADIKPIEMFSKDKHRKDGRCCYCKSCHKKTMDKWTQLNGKHIKEYHILYYQNNKEKCRKYQVENKERRSKYMRVWRQKNKKRLLEYKKHYHRTIEAKDINKRILHNLRSRMRQSLQENAKCNRTVELIGCSVSQLKEHLQSRFGPNMNWDNYGRKGWHIDHIVPCAKFDLSNPEEQKKCFHYTNLQPLWWLENCRKNKF